jgi:hypothetical protein
MPNLCPHTKDVPEMTGPWPLARVPINLGTPQPSDVSVLNKHVFRSAKGQAATVMEKRENV